MERKKNTRDLRNKKKKGEKKPLKLFFLLFHWKSCKRDFYSTNGTSSDFM